MQNILKDIEELVNQLASKINAPKNYLPTYGYSLDGAHPHIEVDKNGQLYYVIVERGQELRRDYAADLDDLLYRIFVDITFSMACSFEVRHRIKNEDFRRQGFSKQEHLLGLLNEKWKIREQAEHEWILKSYPFDDSV